MPAPLSLLRDLAPLLRTDRFGRVQRGFETVGSTNTEAVQWARAGAPEGAIVVAEHQTAGRGRLGRSWTDRSGQGLLFSVVLRPALPPERLSLVTLAGGVAVAEAVEAWTDPAEPRIKWPNDVLLGGRKCCGMLLESSLDAPRFVVLGIGLNVNQDAFPDALADRATSLRLETGRLIPRAALLARLLERLEYWAGQLAAGNDAAVREAFTERMTGRGTAVSVRLTQDGRAARGVVEGIDAAGALCLRTETGTRVLHAGDVTFQSGHAHASAS
ncbi:MAG: biotin--[acetyl-CoA-carboxylase] ligase [Bacteroidota bacterium]